MDFQEQHKKILGGWATSQGLDHEIFDATTVVNPTEPGLGNRLTSGDAALWTLTDGVHLSLEGYRDMAMGLIDLLKAECLSDNNDESSSTFSASQKRRRPDSVVTVPVKKRTSSSAPTMAEWFTGRREPASGANRRYGEGEPSLRGRKPYRGGGWLETPGREFLERQKATKLLSKQPSKMVNRTLQKTFGNPIENSWWDLWAIFRFPYSFSSTFFPFFQLINDLDIPINMLPWILKLCCDSFFFNLPTVGFTTNGWTVFFSIQLERGFAQRSNCDFPS
jgi:hypothetical protein